ncbi:MAG: hypothetical protein XD91_1461 [Clostridiales bacterium 38_11]|nr:MAG: hypothetical protein XD91_1461 [Clostridiales bacterium 38_11]HBH12572.1 DUF1850 domain-containing protein [Clostridiales bacterium]
MKINDNKMKHIHASSLFKKIFIAIIIMILVYITTIYITSIGSRVLVISHQETDEIYLMEKIKPGDTLHFKWIHSFEHIPWTEEFEILDNNQLALHVITVAGFGAGIPENKGTVSIVDGIIIMSDINEIFEEINWINSNSALVFIGINDKELIKGSELPHHELLKLRVEERVFIWPKFL